MNYWIEFLRAMTAKHIKVRYKYAWLGFLWAIVNPLMQIIVMGTVVKFFIIVSIENYFLFLFAGLLPWNFFSLTLMTCTSLISDERYLIEKASFPREIVVLSVVLANFIHLLVSVGVLLTTLIVLNMASGKMVLSASEFFHLLLLIPILFILLLFVSGLSLLASALSVRYKDINFLTQAIMPLWFYATPILYSLQKVPANFFPLFLLNPLTFMVSGFRFAVLQTSIPMPVLLSGVAASILIFFVGWRVFQQESRYFDDWI